MALEIGEELPDKVRVEMCRFLNPTCHDFFYIALYS